MATGPRPHALLFARSPHGEDRRPKGSTPAGVPIPESAVAALARDPDGDLLQEVLEEFPHGTRAFGDLVARHWDRAWSTCQSVLLNEHDAEEATQDVFVRVHRYLPSFRFEARFSTWLQRIARNTALNLLASRQRERLARERVQHDPMVAELWLPWRPPRPGARSLAIRKALLQLDPEDRMILAMHELEGMPYEEIAQVLEVSAGAARMRALRAREKLRALLQRMDRGALKR